MSVSLFVVVSVVGDYDIVETGEWMREAEVVLKIFEFATLLR